MKYYYSMDRVDDPGRESYRGQRVIYALCIFTKYVQGQRSFGNLVAYLLLNPGQMYLYTAIVKIVYRCHNPGINTTLSDNGLRIRQ